MKLKCETKNNHKYPFVYGTKYTKLVFNRAKVRKDISVCALYDYVYREIHRGNICFSNYNPTEIFISKKVKEILISYYMKRGHTREEVEKKLSVFGPKVHPELKGYEIVISEAFATDYSD